MYLKSLEIIGFKSFAKKTNLDFKTAITAIVGPNGSGKSNVSEAFRFVLGEQSLKSMRGKRGEDLIWNGGQGTVGRSNRASVKIVFDNSKRLINIDFDEISIERVVYRDSVSEYLINGSQVRLKDVIELLSGAHIGASGHHIISQGEADHILIANPRERREMIEDALGLKIYQYKKRESQRKLEKTKENIVQVESLRKEITPHLRFLKKQVEKIEKNRELKGELRNLYHEYIKRETVYIEENFAKIFDEKMLPENKLKNLERELIETKKFLSEIPGLDKKRESLLAIENKLTEVRSGQDERSREIGRLEGEINSLTRIVEKTKKETEKEDDAPIPISKIKKLNQEIDLEIKKGEQTDQIDLIRMIFARIRSILLEFFEKNRQNFSHNIIDYQNEILTLEDRKKKLETEIFEIRKQEVEHNIEYNKIKEDIEAEKDKSRDAERKMFQLIAEQKEAYASLSIIKDRENKIKNLKEELDREIKEGAMLIGREIFDFFQTELTGSDGKTLSKEKITEENRTTQEERLRHIQKIKIRIEDAGIGGGDDVLKEYKEVEERDSFLTKEMDDLEKSSNSLSLLIEELDQKLATEFETGVTKINTQFESFFVLMFGGGKASIKVTKEQKNKRTGDEGMEGELDILEGDEDDQKPEVGIEIDVKLPRKNIKGLEMLSGGERALTSIALLFAISQVNPPPFIILDETDAALDEANSRKYGEMIENLAKLSQLILITHNRETMSRAGVLYGVTMGNDGVSKLLSVEFEQAVAVAK
jgi:chromosome segregation protein